MRAVFFACLLLVGPILVAADEKPPEISRAEALVNVGRAVVNDMATFAREGDVDFERLLDRHDLKAVDWTELAKDVPKLEQAIQKVALDLLELQQKNDHAKALIEKYKIKQTAPAENPPQKQ